MSEPSPAQRRSWWKLFRIFCLFSLIALSLLGWYLTTDSFQQMVRRRMVATLEKATGGRVELGEFHTIPLRLRVDARNLTVHGRESTGEVPLLHVDRLQAEMKIISLLSADIRLHSLALEHPVVHIVVYPDGSTNQPVPPLLRSSGKGPVEELFSFSVPRIEVQRGELLWEQNRIPLDFDARDLALNLNYSLLHHQYEARVAVDGATTRLRETPPFVWHAETSLVLGRDHADIRTLTVASAKSEVHFSGRVQNFHNPQVSGDYHGVLDLGDLAALARRPEIRKGTAQLQGTGSWSLQNFSAQGALQAKDVEWAENRIRRGSTNASEGWAALHMQNGRLAATYSITPQRLRISSIRASLFGGELLGEVDVTNWQSSSERAAGGRPAIGRVPPENLQRGSLQFKLTGFPVAPAAAVLSSTRLPLDRLNLAGTASGTVEMSWVHSIRDAEARVNLSLAAPAKTLPGQLPAQGQIEGTYRGSSDEVELSQFHLITPASEIRVTGAPPAASPLRVSFASHNLEEWRPLIEAAYGAEQLPFAVRGWANFNGNASGRLSSPLVSGNLEVYDFETNLPAHDHRPASVVHWDALTGAVQYSENSLALHSGVLIHGHTTVRFDGSTALADGRLLDDSTFNLHFDVRDGDVAELAQLAGWNQPLRGTFHLSASVSGTGASPHGEGRLEIRDGSAYGLPVPSLRSDLRLAGRQFKFSNLETTLYGSPITGSGALNVSSNEFRLNLTGQNLDLARLPRFQSDRFTVDGRADFTAQVSGTPEQPSLEAHVQLRDLAFDKERAGDFFLDAVPRGHKIAVQGHSDFENAELNIQGEIGLEHGLPADLNLTFRHLDIDSLLSLYLPGRVTAPSTTAGTIGVRGTLRSPRDLKVAAELDSFDAEIEHIPLHNAEPIRFEIGDQVFRLEKFHLSGSGTDFMAHGRAQLAEPKELDFALDGTVNVALLQSLNPKVTARGAVGVSLTATGTLAAPVLQGRLEVKDASVSHNDFPSGLNGLNGVLLFDQNRIQIESLVGTTGGGTITLTGSGSYEKGAFLMDLGATAHDVRLRYPQGVSSTANANLHLTGSSSAALLSGDVMVTKQAVAPGFDFGSYLEKGKQPVAVVQHDSLESRLKLNIHVTASPELQMQTAMAKLSGNADLWVRGTADRPVVTGRASANEGGEISYNGTKYRLERGEVTFPNPAKTQPIVDIQAVTRVRDHDVTVTLSGDLSVPNGLKATWRSEPPLPEADVVTLLALGRTQEEAAASQSGGAFGFGGQASNLLINEALNSAINSRLQRLFGASRIKIDPQGLASTTNLVRGPQVTIEQQVANKLSITYSTNVSVASQQIIQAEYNVTHNVSIVGLRDQNGVVSFDIKIRQRKR